MLTAIFWKEAIAFQMTGTFKNVHSARPQPFLSEKRTFCMLALTAKEGGGCEPEDPEKWREHRWRLFLTDPLCEQGQIELIYQSVLERWGRFMDEGSD